MRDEDLLTRKDLQRVAMAVMFVLLAGSAPTWFNPQNQHPSAYDAPWIYPGLSSNR